LEKACQPAALAGALCDLLENHRARAAQQSAAALTMERLGKGGEAPGLRAARAVLDGLTHAT
jgi:Lipid A disaccharide synthetase